MEINTAHQDNFDRHLPNQECIALVSLQNKSEARPSKLATDFGLQTNRAYLRLDSQYYPIEPNPKRYKQSKRVCNLMIRNERLISINLHCFGIIGKYPLFR